MSECKAKLVNDGGEQVLRCEGCETEIARLGRSMYGAQAWLKESMKQFADHARAVKRDREQKKS